MELKAVVWAQKSGLLRVWSIPLSDLIVRNRITRLEAFGLLAWYLERKA